jgi:FkbM family methyltransferase
VSRGRATLAAAGKAARLLRRAGLARPLAAARDAADVALRRSARLPLRAEADGIELRGFLRHRSFLAHVARGDYEPFTRARFLEAVAPGSTVVDVGAHVGLYTLLAARRLGGDGRVLAVEPDPYNYAALQLNVRRAGADGVALLPRAVADSRGEATFQQNLGTIGSSLVERRDVGPVRAITVATTTLDHELAALAPAPVRLVVKLDVEGAEAAALRGLRETAELVDDLIVFCEVNPAALRDAGSGLDEVLGELARLGLEAAWLDEAARDLGPVRAGDEPRKGNLLATRRPG